MNYISSFFTAAPDEPKKRQLSQEQLDFIKQLKSSNGVFNVLTEDDIEQILCLELNDLEFSIVARGKAHLEKRCEFLEASAVFQVKDIVESDPANGEDIQLSIPCIQIENKAFEEDQD